MDDITRGKVAEHAHKYGHDQEKAYEQAQKVLDAGGDVVDYFRVQNVAQRLQLDFDVSFDDWLKTEASLGFQCPRRSEGGPMSQEGVDHWDSREGDCSYCGSMNPDELMRRIVEGTVQLGPTDKNYKAYVHEVMTDEERAKIRERYVDSDTYRAIAEEGVEKAEKWLDAQMQYVAGPHVGKFYFQHFDESQRREFIRLLSEKKVDIGYPGHFYRLPFFCVREAKSVG